MDFRGRNAVTVSEIARELGLSKSTVSRAISCKGRISEATRRRVQDKLKACNLEPSSFRGGGARTGNVAVVVPRDASTGDLPFFQNFVLGISEAVCRRGYDALLVVQGAGEIMPLQRVVSAGKVDGVVLTRIEEGDEASDYLKSTGIPFVVLGTSEDEALHQIDSDQVSGCFEMTGLMIQKGCRNVAVLGGAKNFVVNGMRFEGFRRAIEGSGISMDGCSVEWNLEDPADFDRALPDVMKGNPQCLVCMDDAVCVNVLKWLKRNDYEVPADIQVISFYDNPVLENHAPPVTALNVNVSTLSRKASDLLIDMIEGKEVPVRELVGYEIQIRESFR